MFHNTEIVSEILDSCCPQCGKHTPIPVSLPRSMLEAIIGKPVLCDECGDKLRKQQQQDAQREYQERLVEMSGIPPEFRTWDPTLGNGKLARFIRDHRDQSLLIVGPNAQCKTRAAAYNLLLEAKAGRKCRFCNHADLAMEFAAAMQQSGVDGMNYHRNLLNTNAILLIDDIAKRRLNETGGELLYRLINGVYEGSTSRIWITSNYSLPELHRRFENGDIADAVVSRIDRLINAGKMQMVNTGELQ